jgi:hypothetical protein
MVMMSNVTLGSSEREARLKRGMCIESEISKVLTGEVAALPYKKS